MNVTFFSTPHPANSIKTIGLREDEKARIMDKVYKSEVYQEFIHQWGYAMQMLEIEALRNNQ